METWFKSLKPLHSLMYGYVLILLVGFILLSLPIFHLQPVGLLDNLFIATSALSTTGLATVSVTDSYNFGGQLIILLLIQIGGLGYMSMGSFVVLMRKRKLSKSNADLIKYDFSLPEDFSIPAFIKNMVLFTILIEVIGAIVLAIIFAQNGETDVIWKGIFHSISAFCTAGFSLFSNGFEGYIHNFGLNVIISILSIAGALGFIVFTDIYLRVSGQKERITFTSKIILRFTFIGMLMGAAVLFLSDDNIAAMPAEQGLMVAFFQSMAAFTTVGFNTYNIGIITPAPLFFMVLLMMIGASPSGTGGGMKSTTFTALWAQLQSTFKGRTDVIYKKNKIPNHRVRMAISNFFFYMMVICIGIYLLLLVENHDKFEVIFEAVSALGTVGLSVGITSDLSVLGKLFIIVLMFLGRVGPLSFGIVMFGSDFEEGGILEEDLAI